MNKRTDSRTVVGMTNGWAEEECPSYGLNLRVYADDLEEFVASGRACVSKDFGEKAKSAHVALYQAAKRKGHPVRVMRRGTTVFLARTDVDDEG